MAAAAGIELVDEPRVSRAEALAPPPVADVSQRSDPNDAYQAVRAQMARRREEREAEIAAAMARRRR